MNSILHDLYWGTLRPWETRLERTRDEMDARHEANRLWEQLEKMASPEIRELYEQWQALEDKATLSTMPQVYSMGFSHGVRLVMEALAHN